MDIRKEFNAAVKKTTKVSTALEPFAARFHAFFLANGYSSREDLHLHDYSGWAPDFSEYSLEFIDDAEAKGYTYSFVLPLNDGAEDMKFVVPFEYVADPDAWEAEYVAKRAAELDIATKVLFPRFPNWAEVNPKGITVLDIPSYYISGYAEEGEFICVVWNVAEKGSVIYDYVIRVSDSAIFRAGAHLIPSIVEGKISAV